MFFSYFCFEFKRMEKKLKKEENFFWKSRKLFLLVRKRGKGFFIFANWGLERALFCSLYFCWNALHFFSEASTSSFATRKWSQMHEKCTRRMFQFHTFTPFSHNNVWNAITIIRQRKEKRWERGAFIYLCVYSQQTRGIKRRSK